MYNIKIYTDGACSGNPGAGGWAAVLICGELIKEISGYDNNTTNNKMELTAVIKALKCIKQDKCRIEIFSDSAYVVNAFSQGWIEKWQANSWRTNGKKEVQNKHLWIELVELIRSHTVIFNKVKGHSDDYYNNICDKLARQAINKKGD